MEEDIDFKEGDKVFIRWFGGNSGTYKLHKDKYDNYWVYDSFTGEVNYKAGQVFSDTESVELVEDI